MTQSDYRPLGLMLANRLTDGGGEEIAVVNPATEEEIGRFRAATKADLDRALDDAAKAFVSWKRVPVTQRSDIIRKAANLIRERAQRLARIMTLEQGKTLGESLLEVYASAGVFDWFAEEGRRAYGRVIPARDPSVRYLTRLEPVGPVAAFTPWNMPAVIPARKLAAALAAGCSCIIKPAEETPGILLEMAQALYDAGLPEGVLSVVIGSPAEISAHLIASPVIRKVSFTGSTPVGKLIGKLAAEGVKRCTLELGGHAPVIIAKDADIDKAIAVAGAFKFRNAGQVCVSPTRFLVEDAVFDRFSQGITEFATALKVGDGLDPASQMGPLANPRRQKAMDELVEDAAAHGARIAAGGKRPANRGFFFEPTVLTQAGPHARVLTEEPFGPLAVVNRVADIGEAIGIANAVPYGLAAYAFTRSSDTMRQLGEELESGMVAINNTQIIFPETPFGGVKESGIGSEGGSEGLMGYFDVKLIAEA